MKMAARLITAFFLVLFFLFGFNKLCFAQNNYITPVNNPDVPQNLHTYTQNVFIETMSALICQLSGIDALNKNDNCLGIDSSTKKIGFIRQASDDQIGGAIGVVGDLITVTFTPPVHIYDYTNYLASNFGFSKSAHAQSTGFEGLRPIMHIWSAFRDFIYIFFIFGFVFVGIGIMLRIKIDPRAVMTIQNQIPKIIIGIVLVTFSYAIVGFLIDLMWILIYLLINIFSGIDKNLIPQNLYNLKVNVINFYGSNMGLFSFPWDVGRAFGEIIYSFLENSGTVGKIIAGLMSIIGYLVRGGIIGSFVDLIRGNDPFRENAVVVAQLLSFLIILIAIMFSLIRLWFALVMSYVRILIGTIFAPLWIFTGAIPLVEKKGFGLWLRYMLSNIMVFPLTVAFFLVGKILMDAFKNVEGDRKSVV